jgi:hypothetical protein
MLITSKMVQQITTHSQQAKTCQRTFYSKAATQTVLALLKWKTIVEITD